MAAIPIAHLSVDLDPVDTHLAGYGLACAPCERIYVTSVPRLLDLLDIVGVRATLFVVARDAERQSALWRDAIRRGHEIASHSLTHPMPFATLPSVVLERELAESRHRLQAVTGQPVVGFRAPGWDVDARTLAAIAAAGYRYDASIMPSPALAAGEGLRLLLSGGRKLLWSCTRALPMAFSKRLPHRLDAPAGLWEFPVAVSPVLRVPFTHTLWHLAPRRVCARTFRAIQRAGGPLCYQFHAADLLDLADAIDPRMARHPGIRTPLAIKRAQLEQMLTEIARSYRVITYADAVAAAA